MESYILGVMGSPRRGGNSDLLLDRALEGSAERGARVEKVYLYDLRIAPCRACRGCRPANGSASGCLQQDDMQLLYPKLKAADGLIVATPVYWWGPSAQTKAFVDRWYALVRGEVMRGKRAVVLCAHADDDPRTARHLLGMFEESFRYLNMQFVGTLTAVADERGEIAADEQTMYRAKELGQRLASP